MAFFRPGDIVQITKNVDGQHPNFKRKLAVGDKVLVSKVERKKSYNYGTDVLLYYFSEAGEQGFDGKFARVAYKGNREDCIKFLIKHDRKPKIRKSTLYCWVGLRRNEDIKYENYLPYHLHRHIKSDDTYTNEGVTYHAFHTPEEAFAAASMAWLRLTPAQQTFFISVNSLHEICP